MELGSIFLELSFRPTWMSMKKSTVLVIYVKF